MYHFQGAGVDDDDWHLDDFMRIIAIVSLTRGLKVENKDIAILAMLPGIDTQSITQDE